MSSQSYLNALSLFSGAGGLDLGFHQTGVVRTIAAFDNDEDAVATLLLNKSRLECDSSSKYPKVVLGDLSSKETKAEIIGLAPKIDLVYGGPPCQSFSIMGKKGGTVDPRGALIYAFRDVVSATKPSAFLFENVPHFSRFDGGRVSKSLIGDFHSLGYSTWSGVLNAADFGAVTFRSRYFIVGVIGERSIPAPMPTHSNNPNRDLFGAARPWRTCREVFDAINDAEQKGETLLNHEKVRHTSSTVERFQRLSFGETDHIRKRNRLDPGRPAHSIYVGGRKGKLQARTHIHPYEPRELTPRECATVQGFPLDWKFSGRRDSAVLQSANAVPVQLANAMALFIIELLGWGTCNSEKVSGSSLVKQVNGCVK